MLRTYSPKLYQVIRRIVITHEDTDDVLQNTFLKIWKALPKFKQDSALYSWMYRIATNEALGFLRKRKRNLSLEHLQLVLQDDPYFNGDEAYLKFMAAVEALPQKQKLVFKMKYFDALKYREIAVILGGSEGALKASYFHAVKKIEEIIQSD